MATTTTDSPKKPGKSGNTEEPRNTGRSGRAGRSGVPPVRRIAGPDAASRGRGGQRFILLGLILASVYSLFPVWWLIVAATKDRVGLYQSNGMWFSDMHLWDNLHQLFTYEDGIFLRWTANSFLYAGVGSLGGTLIALATGYGLARFDFPGRGVVFACVVGSFLIPIALLTLPLYLMFSKIGLVDTPWAMLIPCLINPFSVYLAKVYTEATVPFELLEAARIDGAGELRIFFSIVLRMMTTGGATVFLLAFVNTWNAFFLPLTVLRGKENWTLNLGLYYWTGKTLESGIDVTSLVLTGALLSIVPLAVMMTAMRRYWRSGVTLGALK
ncbi:carbohydrate ABC transporter permease [Streptomyces sp. NBC_00481]|uniref:carbohydrate ABC transporter permease n=1 Tax=unclassified Streptomyces TaxID=2593676 RepID=UPI002DD93B5B|nr:MULTISPECIES: carbohydrate ABC transporter permease [unclassified Streptomyces]WRY94915.1 carbohydrate ABC transporter permease [Streptomyces sp. NBC_00481]